MRFACRNATAVESKAKGWTLSGVRPCTPTPSKRNSARISRPFCSSGLLLNTFFNLWWADPVAAVIMVLSSSGRHRAFGARRATIAGVPKRLAGTASRCNNIAHARSAQIPLLARRWGFSGDRFRAYFRNRINLSSLPCKGFPLYPAHSCAKPEASS